jgi:hypothetical protein
MPCLVFKTTDIPKAKIFRFENYWMMHDEFMQKVAHGWDFPTIEGDKAKMMISKLKNLRIILRQWHAQLSNLNKSIENNKMVISFLDTLEEFIGLSLEEWNFQKLIHENLEKLLAQQREYWKQRGRIKWATHGDENTIFFMQMQLSDITKTLLWF